VYSNPRVLLLLLRPSRNKNLWRNARTHASVASELEALIKDDVAEKEGRSAGEAGSVRRRIGDGGEVGLGFYVGISGYSDQAGYELGRPGCARYK